MGRSRTAALAFGAILVGACAIDAAGLAGEDAGVRDDAGASLDAPSIDAGAIDAPRTDAPDTDATVRDGGRGEDAGPDFRDLDWGAAVAIVETVDAPRCETDPVTTSDLRWLFLSRQNAASDGCLEDRRFHVFEWNGGAPIHAAELPRFTGTADKEDNPHPLDGLYVGAPGTIVFYHSAHSGSDARIDWVSLEGSPPAPVGDPLPVGGIDEAGAENMPSLTLDGRILVFSRGEDLFEARGRPPDAYGSPRPLETVNTSDREIDPAISPDGRVIVFERIVGTGDGDLWVARRDDPSGTFSAPTRLDTLNTAETEADPHITATGDLLFARYVLGNARVHIARRIAP